jgi:hypothetical protein
MVIITKIIFILKKYAGVEMSNNYKAIMELIQITKMY